MPVSTIRSALFASLVSLLAAGLATGCPGEGQPRRDISTPPVDGSGTDQAAGSCSATGVASACDPIAATGCAKGSCYVTSTAGASCVCPAGSGQPGDSCNATPECAPGSVCAGTSPPGTCRSTCDPSAAACGGGMKCTFITAYPSFGYCEPN